MKSMAYIHSGLTFLAFTIITPIYGWETIDQCEDVCSPSDDYARGRWERINNAPLALSAEQLESIFGYTNHTNYHLDSWDAHFCSRRLVLYPSMCPPIYLTRLLMFQSSATSVVQINGEAGTALKRMAIDASPKRWAGLIPALSDFLAGGLR